MTPVIPETYTNKDWPRKVKQAVESLEKVVLGGTSKFPLVDGSVPPVLVYQEDGSLVYVEI